MEHKPDKDIHVVFPTGKPHVSYSEIKNWRECPYRHKLQYIDKIESFEQSPYLDYGTIIHNACEHYVKTRELIIDKTISDIRAAWIKNKFDSDEYIKLRTSTAKVQGWTYKHNVVDDWCEWAKNCLEDLPAFLDSEFPNWVYISAEEQLYEHIEHKTINNISFKGFIDCIIGYDSKQGKKYFIIDWKTAGSYGWHSSKVRDFLVNVQLALYKNYWTTKHSVDPSDVYCGFVLLKRDAKPGNTCKLLKVSVGPKTALKADKLVSNMVKSVYSGMSIKNRNSCKFCVYYDTEHCV